jgi:hypothetical protein
MGALQQLFRDHGVDYLARFAEAMPANHQQVIGAIQRCRSDQAGHTLYHCEACGQAHLMARSCGNRHCPGCQHAKTQAWLHCQQARQVPGHHFLLTFTVPEPLRAFLRAHQRLGYQGLFEASAGAIRKLAADPRFIGGELPGFLGVLHTWGRQLQYHPHIHYLVPGGALSTSNRQWHPSGTDFYLPVRALSVIYRAKFRDAMVAQALLADIPAAVWDIDWNVHCQAVGDGQAALAYLSRYVFKVAISEQRIVAVDDHSVTFRYRKVHSNRARTMCLPIMEFIRRFLQHVLPAGFMKVRYFGFLSPSCALPLAEVKARIEMAHAFAKQAPPMIIEPPAPMRCPHCGGSLRFVRAIAPPRLHRPSDPTLIALAYSGP